MKFIVKPALNLTTGYCFGCGERYCEVVCTNNCTIVCTIDCMMN